MNLAPASPSVRAWLVVGLLWVVAALNYLDRVMITTMRASLTESIHMTDAQFGLLTSVFLWVYAFLSPFAGFLADRVSRSRIVIFSLLIWSVVTWLTGHARTFEQLLLTRGLMGISEAFYIPAALALIVDYHHDATRSRATSIHLTGFTIGSGLGGCGGWIAARHGWSAPFLVFGVFGAVYSIVLLFLLRDAPAESGASKPALPNPGVDFFAAIASLFRRWSFTLILLDWGLIAAASWGLVGWLPTYFAERFHLGEGEAGFSATGNLAVATFAGALIGGVWADRWSRSNPRARILVPMIGMCIGAPAIYAATMTGTLSIAIACVMIYGMTRTFTDGNLMPILCLVVNPRYRATAMGVLNLFANLMGGLTIYAGGALRDAKVNVNHIFQFSAAGVLLCALLLYLVKPSPDADLPNALPK